MEPPGGGPAEVRLYRRPAHGAALVDLASLELVAPPRLLEVSTDPTIVEVDGDLGRSAGLYLALVQDGRVVDVARLLAYSGEAASAEDQAEDYWKTGSNTSEEERAESEEDPRRATDVFQYRSTSSSSEDVPGKMDDPPRAPEVRLSSSSDEVLGKGEEDDPPRAPEVRLSRSSDEVLGKSEEDMWDWGSDKKHGDGSENEDNVEEDDDGDGEAGGHDSRSLRMGWKQYQWSSSSDEAVDKNIWDVGSYNDDGDGLEADNDKEEDDDDEMEDEDDADDEIEEEDDDEAEEVDDDDTEDGEDDDEAEEVDDDDQAEEVDDDDDEEDDDEGWLNLRLWPGKRHLRIKLFSGKKWRATKVYRLTWANHEELEDLFESSFKMDISAPIPANTIFRNKDCLMDFELYMLHTPLFDELIAEFRVSVTDFTFCQKVGGEDGCRVFKCLFEGRKFALKTLRLKEPCIMEPREVEIISSLHDKRVMAFYQAWVEPWIYKKRPIAYYLFIQLELCRSTLKDLLLPDNFDTSLDRWNLSEEIAKAVKTIHDESILHRDLKPANIFFGADLGVRIGDFGDSCIGRDELGGYGGTPRLGTQYYSAPELQFAQKITEKADMYSVGVMFLEIFTRFQTVFGRFDVFKGLGKEEVPDFCCNLVGDREGVHGLVRRMIAVEPADRPSDTELLEYLEHNFTSEGLGDGADESQAAG